MGRRSSSIAIRSGVAALVGGFALLVASVLTPVGAAAVTPTPYEGNPSCTALGFAAGLKIDEQPSNGTYTPSTPQVETQGTMPPGLQIEISNVTVDDDVKEVTFDWSATATSTEGERLPFPILTVLVKFGPGGLRYDYPDGATGDTGLYSTKDSISHVDFCWDDSTPPTTTTTTESTTTTEPTTESTEPTTESTEPTTDSTEPTVLPTQLTQPSSTQATVAGVQVTRELPRTGAATLPLAELGAALVGAGVVALAYERRMRTAS